ncbi:MAG: LacI family DNA-binding transcriptional regulator [Candidatus Nanopelagicales bacterium]
MTSMDRGSAPGRPHAGRATLADVARLADVSTKTVSRALSGALNVDPGTRAKVQHAAAALRFRPNALARELRTGGVTNTVGFVIGDLTNPFYTLVAAGVERVLARAGIRMLIAATEDEADREATVVGALLEQRIRALLLVPIAADHGYLEGERQFGTPIVAVDRPLANAVSDSVVFDNRAGARAGVLALLAAGHRRIAFVGSSESLYTHRERLAGYRDALESHGLVVEPRLVRTDGPDISSATWATAHLLAGADPPDAVFAGNNRAAIGALQGAHGHADPIGLLGFDDFELAAALGISVVAHDPQRMGEVATELALRRAEEPMGVVEQVVLPTQVVLRGSEAHMS